MGFNFEQLDVWQMSLQFANDVIDVVEQLDSARKHYRLIEQIEAAAASVAQNIAEGKGRYSKKEFAQYLYIARGSLYETVTLLTLFHQRQWLNVTRYENLMKKSNRIVGKINALIDSVKLNFKQFAASQVYGEPVAVSSEP